MVLEEARAAAVGQCVIYGIAWYGLVWNGGVVLQEQLLASSRVNCL